MRILSLGLIAALIIGASAPVSAQVSTFVEVQMQAAVLPCSDQMAQLTGLSDEEGQPVAEAALPACYVALQKLDAFEKANQAGLNKQEQAYLYYMTGKTIWMTAGAEAVKNNTKVTHNICMQVLAAETAWVNVKAEPGSPYDQDMRANEIRNILLPICQSAYTPTNPAPTAPSEVAPETDPNP